MFSKICSKHPSIKVYENPLIISRVTGSVHTEILIE